MNWAEWRNRAIAALGDSLGTYRDTNGAITPAIAIDPRPVTGRTVTGLEVVVTTSESVTYTPAFNSYHLELTHRVTLKQWQPNATTATALVRLIPLLHPTVVIAPRIPANSTIGNIETQSLTFTELQ